ncbi:hypothetical protein T08_15226 [Trichinella sp. T8]|nr:hypothetical protein T08_15226 [Trichinella sp. T8]
MTPSLRQLFDDVWEILYDETKPIGRLFAKIEQHSEEKREHAFGIICIYICGFLMFSPIAELLCHFICIVYPAMRSAKIVYTSPKMFTLLRIILDTFKKSISEESC